jgi:hypothetical protein
MTTAGRILIIPKGDWSADTQYDMLDLVRHNKASWISKRANKGVEPSEANSDDWQVMAKDGASA